MRNSSCDCGGGNGVDPNPKVLLEKGKGGGLAEESLISETYRREVFDLGNMGGIPGMTFRGLDGIEYSSTEALRKANGEYLKKLWSEKIF